MFLVSSFSSIIYIKKSNLYSLVLIVYTNIELIFRKDRDMPVDQVLKLKYTLDALFGNGVSKYLPKNIDMTFSRKTWSTGIIRSFLNISSMLVYTIRAKLYRLDFLM